MPDELKEPVVKRKKKKMRRKRKKQVQLSGLEGLQIKAVSNVELMSALKEIHWCDSITKKATQQTAARQAVRAADLHSEPLGFIPREGVEYHLDLGDLLD